MPGGSPRLPRLAALGLALLAAACAERGDFGRLKRSTWNDALAATGSLAAEARGEAASRFPLTDEEAELRDRAWRFLVPAGDRFTLDRVLAELVATRILPAAMADPDPRAYLHDLLAADAVSPTSRYRRLGEDVVADTKLIGPIAATGARVLAADRVRLQVLARLASPTPSEIADADGRVAENRCLLAWASAATRFRLESYTHALERLVVAAPGREAVGVERALAGLAAERTGLDRFDLRPLAPACLGDGRPAGPPGATGLVAKG